MGADTSHVEDSSLGIATRQVIGVIGALALAAFIVGICLGVRVLLDGEIMENHFEEDFLRDGGGVLVSVAWGLGNVIFIAIMSIRAVVYPRSTGWRTWSVLIAGEAWILMSLMNGGGYGAREFTYYAVWFCWLLLVTAVVATLRRVHHRGVKRWHRELAELEVENAEKRYDLGRL